MSYSMLWENKENLIEFFYRLLLQSSVKSSGVIIMNYSIPLKQYLFYFSFLLLDVWKLITKFGMVTQKGNMKEIQCVQISKMYK